MSQVPFEGARYLKGETTLPAVVLFHAYTGTPNDVYAVGRKLNRLGYTVLMPLLPGHGTKDIYDLIEMTVDDWYYSAKEHVEWMIQQGFPKVFVFGLSLGGMLASALATDPTIQIDAVGTFNSPITPKFKTDLTATFMTYANNLYERFGETWPQPYDFQEVKDAHYVQMDQLEDLSYRMYPFLPQITLPFFLAQSGRDELIRARDVEYVVKALRSAKLDYQFFPENTHVITVNRNRDDFEQALISFIKQNE